MKTLKLKTGHISLVKGTHAAQYAAQYKQNPQVVTFTIEATTDELREYTPATARDIVHTFTSLAHEFGVAILLVYPHNENKIQGHLGAELANNIIDEITVNENEE